MRHDAEEEDGDQSMQGLGFRLQDLGLLPGLLGSHGRAVSSGGQAQRWGCAERGLVEKTEKLRGWRGCGDEGPDKER